MANPDSSNKMKSPFRNLVVGASNAYISSVLISLIPLLLASSFLGDTAASLVTTIAGMVVLFWSTYSLFWHIAERDRNLVLYGHMQEDRFRALRASGLVMIPIAVMTILALVNSFTAFLPTWFTVLYRVLALPFHFFVRTATENPSVLSCALILICAYSPLAAFLGYRNGYRLVRVLDRVVYKQKPRERDKRLR